MSFNIKIKLALSIDKKRSLIWILAKTKNFKGIHADC